MRFDGATFSPELDEHRLSSQLERVKALMIDGHWRTLGEISQITNGSEASISARLRDLRKERFGSYTIERRRRGDPSDGLFEYRLISSLPQFQFDQDGQGMFA